MSDFENALQNKFKEKILKDELLSKHTTMGVGGPAQFFVSIENTQELLFAIKLARRYQIPFFILGKGSNVIISDLGLKGLVIVNNILSFELLNDYKTKVKPILVEARHENVDKSLEIEKYGLSWDENSSIQFIKVGSGWKLLVLINKLIELGLTGLEWFYGIAGSVGGAVYMNVHGGAHQFFSNFLTELEVINENSEIEKLDVGQLEFDYDYSLFHKRKLIITNVILKLHKGNKLKATRVINEWGREKIIKQPQRSSGCMFQNLPIKKQKELNLPTPSMGYIIDEVLDLAGTKIGGAMISKRHSAFIENLGNAKACDIKALVDLIKSKTNEKYGFKPKLEVEFIGDF